MKYLLPLIALAIIALVALWPELQEAIQPAPAPPAVQQEAGQMVSPRFVSVDKANQPYSIIARSAVQSPGPQNVIDLDRPEAELTKADGTWLALIADYGRLDRDAELVDLSGRVDLFRDDGTEMLTERAHVDLKAGIAWGDLPVQVQGPFGLLTAEGFRFADHGSTVVFLGRSHLLLRRGQSPGQNHDQDQDGAAGRQRRTGDSGGGREPAGAPTREQAAREQTVVPGQPAPGGRP